MILITRAGHAAVGTSTIQRFTEALQRLSIDDANGNIARALKDFLEAAQELQRLITPHNASVHAGLSRISVKRNDAATSLIQWISVFDRVGLFDVDDEIVGRLVDAALRYVWRREETNELIRRAGDAEDRIVAVRDALRALRIDGILVGGSQGGAGDGGGGGEGESAADADEEGTQNDGDVEAFGGAGSVVLHEAGPNSFCVLDN